MRWSAVTVVSFRFAFAGKPREGDVSGQPRALKPLIVSYGYDSERDLAHDLSDSNLQEHIIQQVKDKKFSMVLVSPPCSSWSRARFRQPGPKPVRTAEWPMGFPWLDGHLKRVCEFSNNLALFALRVCKAAQDSGTPYILARPEDLGKTAQG